MIFRQMTGEQFRVNFITDRPTHTHVKADMYTHLYKHC